MNAKLGVLLYLLASSFENEAGNETLVGCFVKRTENRERV